MVRAGVAGTALLGIGTVIQDTGAFSNLTGDRNTNLGVASDSEAIVGIVGQGPVQKNNREPMVEITNNSKATVSYTVSLSTCSDGTLYDNDGDSGCSVTFSVAEGNSQMVDIEASVTGTIPYTISASETHLSFETSETVDAEAGNVASAVLIKAPTKDNEFTANDVDNVFEIKSVDIRDDDGDDDLAEVEYEITEAASGDLVGSKTITFNPTVGRYNPKGNPADSVNPDSGYTITPGTQYRLKTTGTDADGNFETTTVEDTA